MNAATPLPSPSDLIAELESVDDYQCRNNRDGVIEVCHTAAQALRAARDAVDSLTKRAVRAEQEVEHAFQVLSSVGVTRQRAGSVWNGVDVLDTRYRREVSELHNAAADQAVRTRKLEHALAKALCSCAGIKDSPEIDPEAHHTGCPYRNEMEKKINDRDD